MSQNPPGVEYCEVGRRRLGWALTGTIVRRFKEGAALISYTIETDSRWKTRRASINQILAGGNRSLGVEVKRSHWFVNGKDAKRLAGCVDVDLQASPVTNTLPIKRVRPKVGSKMELTAAWVRFPTLRVEPLQQSYERLGNTRYLYRSRGFKSEIDMDPFGLVRRYGDYWISI
jgi:hypothetical protein